MKQINVKDLRFCQNPYCNVKFFLLLIFIFIALNFSQSTQSATYNNLYIAGEFPPSQSGGNRFNATIDATNDVSLSLTFIQNGIQKNKINPTKPFDIKVTLTSNFIAKDFTSASGVVTWPPPFTGSPPNSVNLNANFIDRSNFLFKKTQCNKTTSSLYYYYFNQTPTSCSLTLGNSKYVKVKYINTPSSDEREADGYAALYCHGNITILNQVFDLSGESGNVFERQVSINNNPETVSASAAYRCVVALDMNNSYNSIVEGLRYFRDPDEAYGISISNLQVPYCKRIENVEIEGSDVYFVSNPTEIRFNITNNNEVAIKITSISVEPASFSFNLISPSLPIQINNGNKKEIIGNLYFSGSSLPNNVKIKIKYASLEQDCEDYESEKEKTFNIQTIDLWPLIECPFVNIIEPNENFYKCNSSIQGLPLGKKANLSINITEWIETENGVEIKRQEIAKHELSANEKKEFNISCKPEDGFKFINVSLIADPDNNIMESDENNNEKTVTYVCKAALTCFPFPRILRVFPSSINKAIFYCPYYGTEQKEVCNNPPFYSVSPELINEVLNSDHRRIINTTENNIATLILNTSGIGNFNLPEEVEAKSYISNIKINQTRKIEGQNINVEYKCSLNITAIKLSCKYFI